MARKKLKIPSLAISLNRLPRVAAIGIASLSLILLGVLVWFSWAYLVTPYQQETVTQEKLTKKLETFNVKDFELVRTQATSKTKPIADPGSVNLFGPKP